MARVHVSPREEVIVRDEYRDRRITSKVHHIAAALRHDKDPAYTRRPATVTVYGHRASVTVVERAWHTLLGVVVEESGLVVAETHSLLDHSRLPSLDPWCGVAHFALAGTLEDPSLEQITASSHYAGESELERMLSQIGEGVTGCGFATKIPADPRTDEHANRIMQAFDASEHGFEYPALVEAMASIRQPALVGQE